MTKILIDTATVEEVLEALERYQVKRQDFDRWADEIIALRQALASEAIEQPAQQEPVGCEGAIVNGRFYADRLEHDYKFECEAGPLHLCTDWVEFRRCFEWLAQHTSPPAQRTWVGLTIEDKKEYIAQDFGGSRTDAMDWTEKRLMEKNSD